MEFLDDYEKDFFLKHVLRNLVQRYFRKLILPCIGQQNKAALSGSLSSGILGYSFCLRHLQDKINNASHLL